jgi:hypothetical protein
LVDGETVVLPAVMDGLGAAALYSWRPTPGGTALWQRVFSTSSSASERKVAEVPGLVVVSRAWAVPGLRSQHAIIGWVETVDNWSSVLGVASVDDQGRVTVRRSEPIERTVPSPQQRIGVWGSALDRLEVTVVVSSRNGEAGHRVACFGVSAESPQGRVESAPIELKFGRLVRAAIEYSSHGSDPSAATYVLTSDGSLSEMYKRADRYEAILVRRLVPLDSVLPIVEGYWGERGSDGRLMFGSLQHVM